MLDAARAMAMTAADLLSQPEALDRVKAEFQQTQETICDGELASCLKCYVLFSLPTVGES